MPPSLVKFGMYFLSPFCFAGLVNVSYRVSSMQVQLCRRSMPCNRVLQDSDVVVVFLEILPFSYHWFLNTVAIFDAYKDEDCKPKSKEKKKSVIQ